MKQQLAAVIALQLLLIGCASQPIHQPIQMTRSFDDASYAQYKNQGTATLSGQAFLKTRGGDVKFAAGSVVTLDPVTEYSREWFEKAGKTWSRRNEMPPNGRFAEFRKKTVADASGHFKFSQLSAGSYYVRTECTWHTGSSNYMVPNADIQGGLIFLEVNIAEGEQKDIILSSH